MNKGQVEEKNFANKSQIIPTKIEKEISGENLTYEFTLQENQPFTFYFGYNNLCYSIEKNNKMKFIINCEGRILKCYQFVRILSEATRPFDQIVGNFYQRLPLNYISAIIPLRTSSSADRVVSNLINVCQNQQIENNYISNLNNIAPKLNHTLWSVGVKTICYGQQRRFAEKLRIRGFIKDEDPVKLSKKFDLQFLLPSGLIENDPNIGTQEIEIEVNQIGKPDSDLRVTSTRLSTTLGMAGAKDVSIQFAPSKVILKLNELAVKIITFGFHSFYNKNQENNKFKIIISFIDDKNNKTLLKTLNIQKVRAF